MFLPAWNITVETLIVGLHPDVSLGVDVETVDTPDNAIGFKLFGRIPLGTLGDRVEQRIVHALPQPEPSLGVFEYLIYVVVAQGRRIVRV